MSLHFQARPVNGNRLAAVSVRFTVLRWASRTTSHQTVILAQRAAALTEGEVNVVLVVTSAAVPG